MHLMTQKKSVACAAQGRHVSDGDEVDQVRPGFVTKCEGAVHGGALTQLHCVGSLAFVVRFSRF